MAMMATLLFGVPSPQLTVDPADREHLDKLYAARRVFMSGVAGDRTEQTTKERVYYDYWQDILNHEDFWFSQVFSQSSDYCEWTVGILGTFATIRRQREDVETCLEVLELDERVFDVYRNVADPNNRMEQECLKGLIYKKNLIVINANQQLCNREPAVKAFREAVEYEIENGFSFEEQQFGFILKNDPLDEDYMTMFRLHSTSDDFIWSAMMHAKDLSRGTQTRSDLRVEPWTCDGCGAVEELCGDFKLCSGCKKAHYCERSCQVKHWKGYHKAACKKNKKAPKINVCNETLKAVANVLCRNYAHTVFGHTGQQVTTNQRRAAFPGVVQFFKDFLVRHPEFNVSDSTFQDASRDAGFMSELNVHFEQQPGYGALIVIHQMPECRAHISAVVSPDKTKELLADRDTIADCSSRFVARIALSIALTSAQKEQLENNITSNIVQYLLNHPEFNSHGGYEQFRVSNNCKSILQDTLTEFLELEGMLTDE